MRVTAFAMAMAVLGMAMSGLLHATETITYKYDAKGRLVRVTHAGTVNNGLTTVYSHDKTNNRTNLKTTGALK